MRLPALALVIFALPLLGGCASTSNTPSGSTQPAPSDGMTRLKHRPEEVPQAVRDIEKIIDRRGALMADVIEIDVSANYDWDVALTGDRVIPQGIDLKRGGQSSVAMGRPRARFRNLDIRAHQRIVFHKSGLGVVPYIKIRALGNALYVHDSPESPKPVVRRARAITINNDRMGFLGPENDQPAAVGSTALDPGRAAHPPR